MYFNSLAIIDLETTCLNDPRITEISVVACERRHCGNSGEIPRPLHKFSMCVNPGKKIQQIAMDITGLDNEILSHVNSFDTLLVESLRLFLQRLPQPIVLVAHNGFRFDFPLLKREIMRCSASPLDVYCVDSLPAFRTIFSKPKNSIVAQSELNDPEGDELCMMAIEQYESPVKVSQEVNELTPCRRQKFLLLAPKKPASPKVFAGNDTARRNLFNVAEKNSHQRTVDVFSDYHGERQDFNFDRKPKTFQLQDIFMHFYHYYPQHVHRAEDDAITLLQCILKVPDTFCDYCDKNSVLFENVRC